MLAVLTLFFVVVPLVELMLLIEIGRQIHLLPTLALVIATGVVGAALTRYQGLRTLARFREAMLEGRVPHREILDGFLILLAGAFLLTPGVLTDGVGFLLLVPPFRGWLARRLGEWARRRVVVVSSSGDLRPDHSPGGGPDGGSPQGPIIDAEYTVRKD